MRLDKKNIRIALVIILFCFSANRVTACCDNGACNTHDTCSYTNTFDQTYEVLKCSPGQQVVIDCGEGTDDYYDPSTPYVPWSPYGHETTSCTKTCPPLKGATGYSGIITETKSVWCGPCEETPTPAPTGGDSGGGGGDSGGGESTAYYITGSIQNDINAGVSGNYCSQAFNSALTVDGLNLSAENIVNTYYPSFVNNTFTFNTSSAGNNFTITLDLSGQTGDTNYVCSCPAPIDPNNPYLCQYTGAISPSSNVNFYLREYNLSNNSWFQIFGGNAFGSYGINDNVPYDFCIAEDNCLAALFAPIPGLTNQISSGFPIIAYGNPASITSTDILDYAHSYFSLIDRENNVNSYVIGTDINRPSYDYFYKFVEDSAQEIGNGEDLEPLLSDWTNADWWHENETNFVKVNGNVSVDETQGFNISSGQSLVVFVDGNLTIDDSSTSDSNYQITSVDNGGFLAFVVSGDILITADVGYDLDPAAPTVPTVSIINSNLQGVFIADGTLTTQTKSDIGEVPPDRKFIGAGTFVGWSGVHLDRTFNDGSLGPILNNSQAIENFIYRPDFLANWPTKLKASLSNWREVDPRLVNQE